MKKILIAEDSPDQAKILTVLLKKAGYDVVHVEDGLSALRNLEKDQFDLLITDIMMPAMSGFELLNRLQEENIRLPIIVLTSRQREEDVLKGLSHGALDYLGKPFSPSVVLAKVKKILES